jgi:exonuclease I
VGPGNVGEMKCEQKKMKKEEEEELLPLLLIIIDKLPVLVARARFKYLNRDDKQALGLFSRDHILKAQKRTEATIQVDIYFSDTGTGHM